MRITDPITVTAAAELLRKSRRHTCLLCARGELIAAKWGRDWQVSRASVVSYRPAKPGWPLGKKRKSA